jgi:hypothetical protein
LDLGPLVVGKKMAVGTVVVDRLRGLVFDTRKKSLQVDQIVFEENVEHIICFFSAGNVEYVCGLLSNYSSL